MVSLGIMDINGLTFSDDLIFLNFKMIIIINNYNYMVFIKFMFIIR